MDGIFECLDRPLSLTVSPMVVAKRCEIGPSLLLITNMKSQNPLYTTRKSFAGLPTLAYGRFSLVRAAACSMMRYTNWQPLPLPFSAAAKHRDVPIWGREASTEVTAGVKEDWAEIWERCGKTEDGFSSRSCSSCCQAVMMCWQTSRAPGSIAAVASLMCFRL